MQRYRMLFQGQIKLSPIDLEELQQFLNYYENELSEALVEETLNLFLHVTLGEDSCCYMCQLGLANIIPILLDNGPMKLAAVTV